MSDTPRTDRITANIIIAMGSGSHEEAIAYREEAIREIDSMERELAAANARIAELENHLSPKTLIDEIVDERKEEA